MTNQTPHPETDTDLIYFDADHNYPQPKTWYQPIRLFWLPIIVFVLLFATCAVIVYVKNK